jgi:hypothetical protein
VVSELQHKGLGSYVLYPEVPIHVQRCITSQKTVFSVLVLVRSLNHMQLHIRLYLFCISALISVNNYPPCSSIDRPITRVIKSRKLYGWCLCHYGGRRSAYRVLVERPDRKRSFIQQSTFFYFRNFHFGMGNQTTSPTRFNFLKNLA